MLVTASVTTYVLGQRPVLTDAPAITRARDVVVDRVGRRGSTTPKYVVCVMEPSNTNLDDKPDGWGVAAKFGGPDTLYVFATCIASNAGVFPASVAGGSDGLTRVERLNGR